MPDYLVNCPKHGLVEAIGKSYCSECFESTKRRVGLLESMTFGDAVVVGALLGIMGLLAFAMLCL